MTNNCGCQHTLSYVITYNKVRKTNIVNIWNSRRLALSITLNVLFYLFTDPYIKWHILLIKQGQDPALNVTHDSLFNE